ncbi:hypothetical protein BC332_30011 [Capsicum chinense]|nr:hypothetical protein BC332_30011 [Capsicum chinense]
MEEEEEQLVSTGKSKPKGNNKKENVTDDEDSKSQDEWADRTSSEEEDTSKESSGEEGDIPDKEKLCTNIGRKDNSETVKDKGKQAILRQTLKYKSEQDVTVAIQEPFVKETKIEKYKNSLDMHNCFANCSNKIWIFWKHGLDCSIHSSEDQMTTGRILWEGHYFFLSIVYAKSTTLGREDLWMYMRAFTTTISSPWAVIGDFNSILSAEEKLGGKPHKLSKSIPFMECLYDFSLTDIGYTGSSFTWCNERKEQSIIWKRLDRMVCNNSWNDSVSHCNVHHLPRVGSDHCPY